MTRKEQEERAELEAELAGLRAERKYQNRLYFEMHKGFFIAMGILVAAICVPTILFLSAVWGR